MSNQEKLDTPVKGKTYTLFADGEDTKRYYAEIKRLADVFLQRCPVRKAFGPDTEGGKKTLAFGLENHWGRSEDTPIRQRDSQTVIVHLYPECFGPLEKLALCEEAWQYACHDGGEIAPAHA